MLTSFFFFLLLFSQSQTFAAEGPVFSSGHDLKELTEEKGRDYHAEVFQTCSEVSQAWGVARVAKLKLITVANTEFALWFIDH